MRGKDRRSYAYKCTRYAGYKAREQLRNIRATRALRHRVLRLYGGHCVRCGIEDLDVLTLDHINNDGAQERKRQRCGLPWYRKLLRAPRREDLQILCRNCNAKKYAQFLQARYKERLGKLEHNNN